MRALTVVLALSIACLASPAPAAAQEGHPLKGSWIGKWEKNTIHGADVIIVLNWDGKAITGMINPGTDNIAIKNASLNPDTWTVHLEGDAKDKSGALITYVLDGKIENLAMANRTITGTWKNQKESGALKIGRQ
ncbi:MAG TPA: hypothetical protein VM818_01200 [Vicinamibacterales bacterium]|nr:hypothetical protein [Vicinamibacterales bacterium]